MKRSTVKRVWTDNIHAICTQEAISLKAKLHLADKRIELLKDRADQERLTMNGLQSKLFLSEAKTHAADGRLQWLKETALK